MNGLKESSTKGKIFAYWHKTWEIHSQEYYLHIAEAEHKELSFIKKHYSFQDINVNSITKTVE